MTPLCLGKLAPTPQGLLIFQFIAEYSSPENSPLEYSPSFMEIVYKDFLIYSTLERLAILQIQNRFV